jgi:hypothetical protein
MPKDRMDKEMDIPPSAEGSAEAFEILRLWVDDQQQHVNLRASVWEDPAAWGVTLAFLASAVANAYREEEGLEFEQTLARIMLGYDEAMKQRPKG